MKNEFFFKVLFWLLTAVFLGFIVLMAAFTVPMMLEDPDCPAFFPFLFGGIFLIVIAVYTAIAAAIYRDAPKRCMKKWMWMVIATYVPNFIGLIIYVVVRSSSNSRCTHCGKPVNRDFSVCPYCAGKLDATCGKCGMQVKPEWKACPYCRSEL